MEVLFHDVDAALDNIVRALLHIIEHRQPEGAQETVKAEVGVEQVFDIVHEVEVMMDIVELRDAPYERRYGAGRAFFAGGEVSKDLVGQQAVELNGVKPPGMFGVGAGGKGRFFLVSVQTGWP